MVAGLKKASAGGPWVGLDLGSTSIKVAAIEQTSTGPRLIKYLIQALPVAQEAQAVDRVGWLQTTLNDIGANEVHVTLSGSDVIVRRLMLPLMSVKERLEAVKWQLKDELPFPLDHVALDVQVLGEVWDKDVKKHDVLVAITTDERVREMLALVERAGAKVLSVTPSLTALCRCVTALVPDASTGSLAVLELGATRTHVMLLKEGRLRMSRELPVGSAHLTDALVGVVTCERGEVTIDHLAAESLKRRYGVLGEQSDGVTEDGVPLFHLASLMRPVLEQFATELSRFIDFYKVQMNEAGVSRVLVCGGGALVKSLPAFLAETVGVTVELFNPLMRLPDRALALEPEQVEHDGPRLAVALGAALEHGQGMRLLPAEVRQAREAATAHRTWQLGARVLAAVVLATSMLLQGLVLSQSARVRAREAAWARIKPDAERCRAVMSQGKVLETSISLMERFAHEQPVWAGVLKEMSALTPPAIQLDELTVGQEAGKEATPAYRFHVRASLIEHTDDQGSIAQWVDALEQSIFFADVQLADSQVHSTDSSQTMIELAGRLE